MNTSKLILSFSCGKVNFSRSILLLKRDFYMSEEMKVVCLLCLSDDKLPAEMFWVICQMTNRSQRRFEPFVRWQIARRDVLSHLSDDKLPPETFWAVCQMTNRSQRRFGTSGPSTSRKMTIWEHLHSGVSLEGVFLWIATLTLAMTGEALFGFALSPPWILQIPSILRIAPLLEERNRRGFSSVA